MYNCLPRNNSQVQIKINGLNEILWRKLNLFKKEFGENFKMATWILIQKSYQVVLSIQENVTYKVNPVNINNVLYNLGIIKKPMGLQKFMPQRFLIHKIDFY